MRPPDNRGGRRLVSNSRINICKYKKYYFRHEGSCHDIKKRIDAGLTGIKSLKIYTSKNYFYLINNIYQLAASPLASSGFAAMGDWKELCPFQTSM